ncbi:MAG: flippase-like domain-containing protein [Luteitalea sp.]|nr:flippase-like domain-containing protein [Luteitalea sp.]
MPPSLIHAEVPTIARSSWSSKTIRIAVAVALTAVIVWRTDPSAVLAATSNARVSWLMAAVLLVLLDRSLMAYRWIVLVRVFEAADRVSLSALLRVFFVSTFVGTFLPTSVGADAVRAYGLARGHSTAARSVASVLMDRLLGVLSLLLVALVGLAFAGDLLHESAVLAGIALTAITCAAGASAIYSERVAAVAARLLGVIPLAAVRRVAVNLTTAVRTYAPRHGTVAVVLAGSIAVQMIRIVQAYTLGLALDLRLPFTTYVAFVPIVLLVMLLPITVFGLGTSQLAFAALFARAGVPAGPAVALSLLFVGLGVVGNLPGAFLYATGGGRHPKEAAG